MNTYLFRKSSFRGLLAPIIALTVQQASAQSLSITETISETVGTVRTFTGSNASGSAANTNTWSIGTVGEFQLNGGAYYMRVSASNPTGGMNPANDSLMVIRTVNSQGLTDDGTLSVYGRPTPLTSTPWSLDLNFSFFSDIGMTTPVSLTLLLTSLDIDFNQRYYTSDSTFNANITSDVTNITPASAQSGYTGFTAAGDSVVNNPAHAVASVGIGSSFDVRIAHNAVALFMFEFRDPSTVTGLIPEPSSALLVLGGFAFLGLRRRRPCAA